MACKAVEASQKEILARKALEEMTRQRDAAVRDFRATVVLLERAEKERDLATVKLAQLEIEHDLKMDCEASTTEEACGECRACFKVRGDVALVQLAASRAANDQLRADRERLDLARDSVTLELPLERRA